MNKELFIAYQNIPNVMAFLPFLCKRTVVTQRNFFMPVAGQKYATAYAPKENHHFLHSPGTDARDIIAATGSSRKSCDS